MNRNLRIIAAVIAALAGSIEIYTAIAERPAGSPMPMGAIAMGGFWVAVALYLVGSVIRQRQRRQ